MIGQVIENALRYMLPLTYPQSVNNLSPGYSFLHKYAPMHKIKFSILFLSWGAGFAISLACAFYFPVNNQFNLCDGFSMSPKPTIGRIVIYSTKANPETLYPAMVTHVNINGSVELAVFQIHQTTYAHGVEESSDFEPGRWTWPSRV